MTCRDHFRRSGLLAASAECLDCEWDAEGRNAVGLAAQHHDRHGHTVRATQSIGIRYGLLPGEEQGQRQDQDAQ